MLMVSCKLGWHFSPSTYHVRAPAPPLCLVLTLCSRHLCFPLIIPASFALSDTRACAITLMLFFSAKDFPADKMVLGSGKRLLGFVPSHRDSLLCVPRLFFALRPNFVPLESADQTRPRPRKPRSTRTFATLPSGAL